MKSLKLLLIFSLLFSFIAISYCQTVEEPELIPKEILFGNPENTIPRISPDASKLAYIAPVDNVLNIWVKTVGKDDERPITNDDNRGIYRYFWAEDNKHIIYLQDVDGNENWRLYQVDLETNEIKDLTPFEDVQVRIIDRDKNYPNELLIEMNKEDEMLHDAYHLDLLTGELLLIAKNPGNILKWKTDTDFNIRAAFAATPDGGFDLLIREDNDSEWTELLTWDSENALSSYPVSFSKDGDYLYLMDSRNSNTSRLVKLEISTGNIEVIAEDPIYDVSSVFIHPDDYNIQAVSFTKERDEWIVLDKTIEDDFNIIKELDDGDFFIYNRDNNNENWLVAFTRDIGPVPFYLYNRNTKEATFLFYNQPNLNNYTLSSIEPISFQSRDGLTIHGYITFPVGKERENLPMVLNVHGGPYARDTWGYNPEVQWLANRGYAVLQINFRGSIGYGKDFINAADKEWGGKMHDDLIDGVNWAIDQGYADPEKIAIYGGSYGGYAALVGATFTPDIFCCAVDIVGPSNLLTFIQSIPPYWSSIKAMLYKRIGNPETEEDFLISRSPLFKVDKIKIPVLIAQGANDPRVPQEESEQIVQAMIDNNIDYEYLLFEDEGHGFIKPENRLRFYSTAEKFLSKHLGGRYEE